MKSARSWRLIRFSFVTDEGINFADRKKALEQRNKNASKKILPFVTQYLPAFPNLKNILMGKWHLIENQPYLRKIFKEPPLISYRKGKSLKDTQVRANAIKVLRPIYLRTAGVVQARQHFETLNSNPCARFQFLSETKLIKSCRLPS